MAAITTGPPIKEEVEPDFIKPLGSDELGASADMPIVLEGEDPIKEEAGESADLPDSALRGIGYDRLSAIVIIDDEVSEVKKQSTPFTFTPRKTERRAKEQFRLLRKRLRQGYSNDGYGEPPETAGTTTYEEEMAILEQENGESDRRRQATGIAGYERIESDDDGLFVPPEPKRPRRTRRRRQDSPEEETETPRRHALQSLMSGNVFRDAAATRDAPDLPEITGTRKADALKQLLDSVPKEHRKKARTERKELLDASRKFKPVARPDGHGDWKITNMVTSLKSYQMIGGGFMRERENDDQKPHGGLCADAMGLGKTVVTIANIVNSRPKRSVPGEPKATLIVLPATLVTQWAEEIQRHVKPKLKLKVLTYRAGNRVESNNPEGFLAKFDVVLTTYYEVQQSYPKVEVPLELQTAEEKDEWWKKHYEENKGVLHRVIWKRVVLDEAQQIKNFRSKTSLACRALEGKYRWALSGTPILNSPLELYPFFKFLKVPLTASFRVFKENYYNPGPNEEPLERLSLMVSRFMIRRTHKDTLFGAPILRLPKANDRIHWVKFNDLERGIYEIIYRRMVQRVNSFAQENTLERNYRNVLVMLLRLRQMTGNLLMVEVVMRDLLEREDHEKIRELVEIEVPRHDKRREQLIELRRLLSVLPKDENNEGKDEVVADTLQPETPSDTGLMNVPEDEISIGGQHGRTFNFAKYLQDLRTGSRWEEVKERTTCVICCQLPEDPYFTACYHLYCRECLNEHQLQCANEGLSYARCKLCQIKFKWAYPCDDFDLESILSEAEDAEINSAAPPIHRWRKKRKGKKKRDQSDAVVTRSWIEKHGTVLPSAKTMAIKAQILNWLEKDPACKILVYTQFLSMIQIMKKICDLENWSCQEYTGQMSIASRDKALEKFKTNNVSILLASLKCGGLGLNLTEAKHVISIDPWWNSAIEQQAFCRVFRMGQQEETSMTRFVVEGTIDEKLIDMQDRKQAEIDQVMGDNGPTRENISMGDMLQLFGQVGEDGQGRPFVAVEDKETLPRYNADSEDEGDED